MQQLTEALQTNALTLGRDINFEVNDTLGKTIVRVMDSESGELIRQVPPEAVVQAAVALAELIGEKRADPPNGLLVQTKA
jgi:flagellar protein FlaG